MAAPPFFRGGVSLLRLRHHRMSAIAGSFAWTPLRRPLCSSGTESTRSDLDESAKPHELLRVEEPPKLFDRVDDPECRKWKENEEEILNDIEPIVFLTKDILHSNRYVDGERLSTEDEKVVMEKLLAYHPHSKDKIGCGLDSIIVDRHPQFRHSRCLFVVRTDGGWIDFSYQKCLREYIRNKYPSYAERFIQEHLKRSSG